MRKTLAIAVAFSMISTPLLARQCVFMEPPTEFDHHPTVDFVVEKVSLSLVTRLCNSIGLNEEFGQVAYGCTRISKGQPAKIIVAAMDIEISSSVQHCIIEHEYGHINGAPADHKGWVEKVCC